MSLDIQKAFDSLSHSYLQNIFKFYNFGPNIGRWLTLLSTNRAARIIINSNISTEIFELERGNAQGDTISPFLFNLGYQILLFNLEFDLQIAGLTERVELGPDFPPLPLHAQQIWSPAAEPGRAMSGWTAGQSRPRDNSPRSSSSSRTSPRTCRRWRGGWWSSPPSPPNPPPPTPSSPPPSLQHRLARRLQHGGPHIWQALGNHRTGERFSLQLRRFQLRFRGGFGGHR